MGDDGDVVQSSSPAGPPEADSDPERARPILTRREFLVGAGAGVAASAAVAGVATVVQSGSKASVVTPVPSVGGPALVVPAPPGAAIAPPGVTAPGAVQATGPIAEKQIALKINGHTYKVMVQARATLADVIRYQVGLTGTKIGCNRAECGACTVVMDGKNVYSCTQMAFASEGKEIMTVEGLASDPSRFEGLHPIQQGFIVKDAPQCGFCMSGQMMSSYALLQAQPKPDLDQIRMGLSGNICRCGNYNHLWDAVAWAADHSA
jgi:aerobic-type carbon monoxide dehydrogenase small subunit (CoxS/CutS family)